MFLAAYDQFIELALRNGHIPENPEVADGDVERGHSQDVSWSGRVAADGLPVLVRAPPEPDESVFHPGKFDIVSVTGRGVVLVPFVSSCELSYRTSVRSSSVHKWSVYFQPEGYVSVSSVGRSTTFSTRSASTCVYWKSSSCGIPCVLG
jgi:hypothetical protein